MVKVTMQITNVSMVNVAGNLISWTCK